MVLSVILILGMLLIVYVYVKLQYFTLRRSLGGLSPHFFFGNLIQTGVLSGKKQIFEVAIQLQRQFGDIFQFWPGSTRLIVLCNADDIRHVMTHGHIYDQGDINTSTLRLFLNSALVCTKGSEYKRHASFTLPCFRRGKLIKHVDWIITCTDKVLLDQWRSSKHNHIHIDIDQKLKQLVLSMFSYIAYEHSFDLPVSHELHQALNDFSGVFATLSIMPNFLIKILLKFSPTYNRSVKTIQRYSNMLLENEQNKDQGLITVREEANSSLLASFVAALNKSKTVNTTNVEHRNNTLSHEEVLNEMLFFLLSGYESSWTALTWFIHLMSKHSQVQAKIKAELSEINNRITLEQLDSLVYLDAVIREVLRFAPPFDFTARTLNTDDHLPATQVQLYKGDQIAIPIFNLSRDKRYWKIDPELFYPERFLDEDADKNHHPYAFLPFGAGNRKCAGQHLVLLELKVIAARLMQYVTFGDGGMEVNAGRHHQNTATIIPKPVGVTISFD